jgi:hypothetical protein
MSSREPDAVTPLLEACRHRELLGATVDWRSRQLEILDLFGRDDLRVVLVAAGRQGGKSSMAIATAIWGATMRPDLDAEMRGKVRYALIASPTEDQSRELIRVAAGMIEASPVLAPLAVVRADRIDFTLPSGAKTAIKALPANPRSVRGMTASIVLADEGAHFNSDAAGLNNDVKMIEALEGSMSVFDAIGKSKLILISTPAGEAGEFHRLFCDAQDGSLPAAAAVQAPAWELNPALDNEEWRESKRRLLGVDGFEQEHGGRFVAGGGAFFDLRELEFEAAPARPEDLKRITIGLDPAFHGDHFGVAVIGESTTEPGLLLAGPLAGIEPSGGRLRSLDRRRAREDRTLERVAEIIEPYTKHGARIVTDLHQADAVSSFFGRRGVPVKVINPTGPLQTAAFTSMRTRLLDGSLRLWKEPQLVEELRRIRAKDSESIVLARFGGSHSDIAAAAALAVHDLRNVTGLREDMPRAGRSQWSRINAELPGPGNDPGRRNAPGPLGSDIRTGDARPPTRRPLSMRDLKF